MDTNRILEMLETLSLADLLAIRAKADELITTIEAWQQPDEHPKGKTYRQEYTKCNKPACTKCTNGPGHGPYWYSYHREGKKLHKQYIGKTRPNT